VLAGIFGQPRHGNGDRSYFIEARAARKPEGPRRRMQLPDRDSRLFSGRRRQTISDAYSTQFRLGADYARANRVEMMGGSFITRLHRGQLWQAFMLGTNSARLVYNSRLQSERGWRRPGFDLCRC